MLWPAALWAQDSQQTAIFNRPFITGGQRAAVGGYTEINLNYQGEEGVNEGPSFELRRFNLFLYSELGPQLRFLAEIEFEDNAEEIKIETALLDLDLLPELTLRAGVLLTPLGAFNQAHDGPLWDFIERPLVSTTIIPSTFSEVGAGAHGTLLLGPVSLDYQVYATQGLGDGVLDNDTGRASIPHGRDPALITQDNNGEPALTGRVAARYADLAELGASAWRGAYNTHTLDGLNVDDPRSLTLAALDLALTPPWFTLRAEAAFAAIDLPASLASSFGDRQWGLHVDIVAPLYRFDLPGLGASTFDLGARVEHVDYHAGDLANGDDAGAEITRLTGVLAFRPGADTVLRLNYTYQWTTDRVGNAPARGAAVQAGLATYF